jgi:hypothetical protein
MRIRLKKKRFVFVSHSSKDTWVAKQIAQRIKECGAKPFLDEAEVEVGEDFEEEIRLFLNRADELVALLTPWALERPYVWAELSATWSRGIVNVAVLHGLTPTELQSKPGIPVFLKKHDLIDINSLEKYFAQLKIGVIPNCSKTGVIR